MPRGRRGPGLLGTAVIVGGAAHMGAKSAQKGQQEAAQNQQIAELQAQQAAAVAPPPVAAPPAPAAAAEPDPAAEIQKYAALKDQGLITEEEFAAKKKAILGI
jgi:hemolysin activation/secretion protein